MRSGEEFFNLYSHDLIRVAVAVPGVRVADPLFNARQTISLLEAAAEQRVVAVLFPELCLSAYSCEDLFHQRALLDASEAALVEVVRASTRLPLIAVVGVPVTVDHHLYNCGVVLSGGRILGAAPKTYLPNYREFYELRQFRAADTALRHEITLGGQSGVPFGSRLLFQLEKQPLATFHVEICEDLWVPLPPSTYAALAGATIPLNLSASNVTVAKADYRHQLVASQSARCLAAYVYSAAGPGESTTDLAWDGHAIAYENTLRQVKASLRTFLDRFFRLSQFKRSCIPNAPKVGSGGSLSPRGDWRAPSDGEATVWLARLDVIPDTE